MSRGDPTVFVTRPITLAILVLAVFTAVVAIRRQRQGAGVHAPAP